MPELATEAIREHLNRILGSSLFDRSQRQSAFLRFVVEKTLEGRQSDIKEYEIAIQVYERREDHSTRTDPIVRVEASRLRAKLLEYYSNEGREERIRIELPKGTYVPDFVALDLPSSEVRNEAKPDPVPAATVVRSRRWLWLLGLIPVLTITLWLGLRQPGGPPLRIPDSRIPRSYAVLPFRDTTGHDGEFAENLTEAVIGEMRRVGWPNWQIRPPVLRGTPNKKQDAEAILSGAVTREGDRVRMTASLEHASGLVLWNGNMERATREWPDEPSLLLNMSASLGEAMNVALMERQEQEWNSVYPPRAQARRDWLTAEDLWRKQEADSVRASLPLLRSVLHMDPNFAWAHASLAHAYLKASEFGLGDQEELSRKAHEETAKALELGPYLPMAHAAAARVALHLDWDFQAANATCIAALGAVPAGGTIRNECAAVQSLSERYDLAERIALETVFRIPDNINALTELAAVHYRQRNNDKALFYAADAVRVRPQSYSGRELLVLAQLARKSFDSAAVTAKEGEAIPGEAARFVALEALTSAFQGNREQAAAEIARAEKAYADGRAHTALIRPYLALGNTDAARKLIDEGIRRRDYTLLEMRLDPLVIDLDSNKLFDAVRHKVGL